MASNGVRLGEKQIERALSRMGAKVARANELSAKARELNAESNKLLMEVQLELSELYISLDDILTTSATADEAEGLRVEAGGKLTKGPWRTAAGGNLACSWRMDE